MPRARNPKRRRTIRRAPAKKRRRLKMPLRLRTYNFKRSWNSVYDLSTLAGNFNTTNHSFQLSNLPNHEEFKNLFGQYKINRVVITVTPSYNLAAAGSGATQIMMYRVYDPTGTYEVNLEHEFDEHQGTKRIALLTPGSKPRVVANFKPKVLVETYKTLNTTGHAARSMWLNVEHDTVNHFGITFGYKTVNGTNFNTGHVPKVLVHYQLYLSFKGVR